MDFGALLQTAKQNEHSSKKDVRYYNTKFSAPKKEGKKDKALSANIQKFLARKEEEERLKAKADNRRKEELLALRSKDKKAQRRVNVMLKRTKSANQSVIQDAVDKDNTAVTLVGPAQPDEDDYGYVSQEASAFYNKMMEKYSKIPDDPKFSISKRKASTNLSNTKDRVKAALEREKEELLLPRRKRKHREEGEQTVEYEEKESEPSPSKSKPKPTAPPPINFLELLKLAEQKQHEPIMIEVKPKEEDEPLRTKKQKRELERLQQKKDRPATSQINTPLPTNKTPKLPPAQITDKTRNSGLSNNKSTSSNDPFRDSRVLSNNNNQPSIKSGEERLKTSSSNMSYNNKLKTNVSNTSLNKLKTASAPQNPNFKRLNGNVSVVGGNCNIEQNRLKNSTMLKANEKNANITKSQIHQQQSNSNIKKSQEYKPSPIRNPEKKILSMKGSLDASSKRIAESSSNATARNDPKMYGITKDSKQRLSNENTKLDFPPKNTQVKRFPPDMQRKQFPPKDLKPKQLPPNTVQTKKYPPRDMKQRQLINKRRIIDDDEEEYDPDMDDFIDDGPEDVEDYSKYIKDIFGYDKSKYRTVDDDDIEEATFAQQMREDVRSTRIGIMEDLEDIKREKEEKRQKALMKKRKL